MNYLELFKETARKCGVAIPTTTVSQTGENLRLLGYVDQAWLFVQGEHNNWNFMWARAEESLVADTQDYAPRSAPWSITDLSYINPDTMALYDASEADETRIGYRPYMQYKRYYDIGTHTAAQPTIFTILPDRQVRFYPTPDDTYTVQFDYYKRPTSLSGDSTEPEIPNVDLHWIIVERAKMLYMEYEEAVGPAKISALEYMGLLRQLRREELPLVDIELPVLA